MLHKCFLLLHLWCIEKEMNFYDIFSLDISNWHEENSRVLVWRYS